MRSRAMGRRLAALFMFVGAQRLAAQARAVTDSGAHVAVTALLASAHVPVMHWPTINDVVPDLQQLYETADAPLRGRVTEWQPRRVARHLRRCAQCERVARAPIAQRDPYLLALNNAEIVSAAERVIPATPATIRAVAAGRARLRQRPGCWCAISRSGAPPQSMPRCVR